MRVTRHYSWDMGHRLKDHVGLCRNLHGHRYTVEVTIDGDLKTSGSECGMVVDFITLDDMIHRAIGGWDHAVMLQRGDPLLDVLLNYNLQSSEQLRIEPVAYAPTAENIATDIAGRLKRHMQVGSVKVFETPRSSAEWEALST